MKAIINLLRLVLALVMAVLLVLSSWLLLSRYIWKAEVPSLLGYSALTVTSSSMEPAFSEGDVILLQEKENYERGDALAFYSPERTEIVTHRIVGQNSGGFITRGDANTTEDTTLLTMENIIGAVWVSLPMAGVLLDFLTWPLSAPIILLLGILLIGLPGLAFRNRKPRGRHGG